MASLTADENRLLKDLGGFIEPVEIFDPAGNYLGHFVPAKEENATLQEVLGWLKLLEKEMDRRKLAAEKEFTRDEALAYFQSLRKKSRNGLQTAK